MTASGTDEGTLNLKQGLATSPPDNWRRSPSSSAYPTESFFNIDERRSMPNSVSSPARQPRPVRRVIPPPAAGSRFHMPMAARRAPRGSAKNCIGIYADIDPELHAAYERAVAERNITKRQLIEAALRRELADPTITAAQGGLYDVA